MRTLSLLATDEVQGLLQRLVEPISSEEYRATVTSLGEQFGRSLDKLLAGVKSLLLVCTNEDADFLARGVLRGLGSFQGPSIALACFWNDRVRLEGKTDLSVELAPIVRKYVEPGECDAILVLKSIIASGCVVRTNMTEIIDDRNPNRVLIFSPVVLKGADDRLREEFDPDIARRFEFFWFAEDTETNDKGEVVPGVGGNVYERLGLGSEKTRYVPELVKERRKLATSLGRPLQPPVTPGLEQPVVGNHIRLADKAALGPNSWIPQAAQDKNVIASQHAVTDLAKHRPRTTDLIVGVIQAIVLDEIEQLAEPGRTLIRSTFFGGQSLREVADRLGIPYATAWTHQKQALLTIRENLRGNWLVKGYFDVMYPKEENPAE